MPFFRNTNTVNYFKIDITFCIVFAFILSIHQNKIYLIRVPTRRHRFTKFDWMMSYLNKSISANWINETSILFLLDQSLLELKEYYTSLVYLFYFINFIIFIIIISFIIFIIIISNKIDNLVYIMNVMYITNLMG